MSKREFGDAWVAGRMWVCVGKGVAGIGALYRTLARTRAATGGTTRERLTNGSLTAADYCRVSHRTVRVECVAISHDQRWFCLRRPCSRAAMAGRLPFRSRPRLPKRLLLPVPSG